MGFHGCSAHSGKQCWFGSLAISTTAATCTTHLLLLWGREKKPGGSREEHMQGTHGQGCDQQKAKKGLSQ
jgi:hypothetical protein